MVLFTVPDGDLFFFVHYWKNKRLLNPDKKLQEATRNVIMGSKLIPLETLSFVKKKYKTLHLGGK